MPYKHKTTPFQHQAEWLDKTAQLELHAVFWDQGTGKSKLIIDTAAQLWEAGEIDAVLIVAPSCVHANWMQEEIPTHLPDEVMERSRLQVYRSGRGVSTRLWHQAQVNETLRFKGLSWMAMSYPGFMTTAGKSTAWSFLRDRRCLYVLDESMFIKTPGAKRTISIVASGKHAPYRRILCGTPVANSPFDVYSQIKFLDEGFWRRRGLKRALAFRHFFGIFAQGHTSEGRQMEWVVKYQNLDLMREWLEPISSRVLKEEVLDLPEKLYSKRHFRMTPAQKRLYNTLRKDFMVELKSGELITAALVITRLLRLQQITCGYLPTDSGTLHQIDPDQPTPRLGVIRELAESISSQAIIWANWNEDIDQILAMLNQHEERAVRFDGQISEAERESNKARFKSGDVQFFVSKATVGGTGHTLTEAKTVIYYNNGYSLTNRLQSEDRAHRIGQDHKVDYIDIMGEGTIDEKIVHALRNKFDIAAEVTGDVAKEWI